MTFLVVPGEHDLTAVLAALPVKARQTSSGPARLALAELIHRGEDVDWNRTDFGVLWAASHTLVCPPGGLLLLTGDPAWPAALSRGFGTCWVFCTAFAAGHIARFEQGRRVLHVDELGCAEPAQPGFETPLRDTEAEPLRALSALLGVDDARDTLRALPTPAALCAIIEQ